MDLGKITLKKIKKYVSYTIFIKKVPDAYSKYILMYSFFPNIHESLLISRWSNDYIILINSSIMVKKLQLKKIVIRITNFERNNLGA